jgi:hypothetical protein
VLHFGRFFALIGTEKLVKGTNSLAYFPGASTMKKSLILLGPPRKNFCIEDFIFTFPFFQKLYHSISRTFFVIIYKTQQALQHLIIKTIRACG